MTMKSLKFSLPLVLAFAATLQATDADAQGRGNGNGNKDRDRVEQRDRDRDRDDDRDDDDDDDRAERRRDDRRDEPRFERRESTQRRRNVPPGWCQGRGNPHNTPENCGYRGQRSSGDRRYDDLRTNTRNTSRSGSSYDQAHRDFHYSHDRQCRERAAQRPLDMRWQVQVRSECKARHDEFHRRWNISHR